MLQMKSPKPPEVRRTRESVGLSQTAAGALIGRSLRTWQAYETDGRDGRTIDPIIWQVWLIRAGLAPLDSIYGEK